MRIALFLLIIFLSACGSSGIINGNLINQPVPTNQARIVINRNDAILYFASGVNVTINGIKEESLARGATLIKNIPAGRTNLSVDATADFGKFTVTFDAAKGKTYFIEISPRYETFGRSLEWSGLNAIFGENTGPFKAKIKEIR
jgi:hypothetical protein